MHVVHSDWCTLNCTCVETGCVPDSTYAYAFTNYFPSIIESIHVAPILKIKGRPRWLAQLLLM